VGEWEVVKVKVKAIIRGPWVLREGELVGWARERKEGLSATACLRVRVRVSRRCGRRRVQMQVIARTTLRSLRRLGRHARRLHLHLDMDTDMVMAIMLLLMLMRE
jgi:hypothetical protein